MFSRNAAKVTARADGPIHQTGPIFTEASSEHASPFTLTAYRSGLLAASSGTARHSPDGAAGQLRSVRWAQRA
jgi:hypothetical protein